MIYASPLYYSELPNSVDFIFINFVLDFIVRTAGSSGRVEADRGGGWPGHILGWSTGSRSSRHVKSHRYVRNC